MTRRGSYPSLLRRPLKGLPNGRRRASGPHGVSRALAEAPEAFLGLFDGVNVGKQLVKVSEREHGDA